MEQHNDIGTKEDLARYRITVAGDNLRAAKILLDNKELKSANNRAYYAVFHAINAVHALDGNSYKRHKDAIGNFNKIYIKEEIFPKEYGRKLAELEEIRHASDYDDFYIVSVEEAVEQVKIAEEFISLVDSYIHTRIDNSII